MNKDLYNNNQGKKFLLRFTSAAGGSMDESKIPYIEISGTIEGITDDALIVPCTRYLYREMIHASSPIYEQDREGNVSSYSDKEVVDKLIKKLIPMMNQVQFDGVLRFELKLRVRISLTLVITKEEEALLEWYR